MPVRRLVRCGGVVEATESFSLIVQRGNFLALILILRASFITAIAQCKSTRAECVVCGVKFSILRRGSLRTLI